MSKFNDFQVVSDSEIDFFLPKSFGKAIDDSADEKRKLIVGGCDSKLQGYHVGHTLFRTMVSMGLVHDFMPNEKTLLTSRGKLFLMQEIGIDYVDNIYELKEVEKQVDIEKYLSKHLEDFIVSVVGGKPEKLSKMISEYTSESNRILKSCRKEKIYAPHVFLLTILKFGFFKHDETPLLDWVKAKNIEYSHLLPKIDRYDPETSPEPERKEEWCECELA